MKITNVHNLPTVFENFDKAHAYSNGGSKYSATTLIDSPQVSRLRSRHYSSLEEDVSDQVWSILGTAVHAILESGAERDQVVEERFFSEVMCVDEMRTNASAPFHRTVEVSGQVDLQTPTPEGMILSDYKTTRAYTVQAAKDGKPEWTKQLNIYAALARRNGVKVAGLEVIAILRDWSKAGLDRSPDYPASPVVRVPVEMWSEKTAETFLVECVRRHEGGYSPCSFEEMWARPPVFAFHELAKSGQLRKRATRLFDNRTDAENASLDSPGSQVIERPRIFTRCEGNYCNVARFCDQFAELKKGSSE